MLLRDYIPSASPTVCKRYLRALSDSLMVGGGGLWQGVREIGPNGGVLSVYIPNWIEEDGATKLVEWIV